MNTLTFFATLAVGLILGVSAGGIFQQHLDTKEFVRMGNQIADYEERAEKLTEDYELRIERMVDKLDTCQNNWRTDAQKCIGKLSTCSVEIFGAVSEFCERQYPLE